MDNKIGEANNYFALQILSELNVNDTNVLFSPWSLFDALAMTFVGARGSTADQMSKALGIKCPDSLQGIHQTQMQMKDISSVKSANKIWVQKKLDLQSEFQAHLKNYFLSETGEVDYLQDSEGARQEINAWVEEQTKGKIKNLIPSGMLNALTRLVLTSAVYFKGSWLHEFPKHSTKPMKFQIDANNSLKVQMMFMNAKKDVSYHEEDKFQVLALPYVGERLTMNIILPKEGTSIDAVLASLKSGKALMKQCLSPSTRPKNINIYIPRFKFDFNKTYNAILQSLGLTDMFSDAVADFSGITSEKPGIKVNSVIQKAFIDVNEEGTEAAAATAVVMTFGCAMPMLPPITFKADRPFVFLICDNKTNIILFMGKVMDPSKEN